MMDGYVVLTQIAAASAIDQAGRTVVGLYGLDTSGRVWLNIDNAWSQIGNPTVEKTPLSTPE